MSTKIEWTQETWSPIIGCNKISSGCANCYAERMAVRLAANPKTKDDYGPVISEGIWSGRTQLRTEILKKPFSWKKPRMIFVCSMGDLFHGTVIWTWLDKVFNIIRKCPQHTFQILTKRPEFAKAFSFMFEDLSNVWLGVTAENQEEADKRIPVLLEIPVEKRFVSIEPMLGPVDISDYLHDSNCNEIRRDEGICICHEPREIHLDWIIAGGETGPSARPMHPEWVTQIRDQCIEANVPFFFKSWGEWIPVTYIKEDRKRCVNITPDPGEILLKDPTLINMIKSRNHPEFKSKLCGKY